MKRIFLGLFLVFGFSLAAKAATNCNFTTAGTEMSLDSSCYTDQQIVTPSSVTNLDLNGNTVTGIDPSGGHFVGAVIKAGGPVLNVSNGIVTVSGLTDLCDNGLNRLRGISFRGASGSVTNVKVLNINQGASGCQEGIGIDVISLSPVTMHVLIDGVTITGYQKGGIVANGNVDVAVTNSTVDGLGVVNYIARNGIQLGFGATGRISKTDIVGNAYSGGPDVACGILIAGGPAYGSPYSSGVQVVNAHLTNNDVGIYSYNAESDLITAALSATNNKFINNVITNNQITNQIYQAGIYDLGNNDKIINNDIEGIGYVSQASIISIFTIDANPLYTNRPKVHAND